MALPSPPPPALLLMSGLCRNYHAVLGRGTAGMPQRPVTEKVQLELFWLVEGLLEPTAPRLHSSFWNRTWFLWGIVGPQLRQLL